jgi:hypothetical protein
MRDKKISADISKEANELLNSYCLKHERSKGYLLEKMIRKFCGEQESTVTNNTAAEKPKTKKAPRKKFIKPTVEEAGNYFVEKGFGFEMGQQFVDHYTTNGWLVGKMKAPMKDWKSAIRTWLVGKTPVSASKPVEIKTPADAIALVKKGQITALNQIPREHRKMIETQFILGNYKPETMQELTNIGMAV